MSLCGVCTIRHTKYTCCRDAEVRAIIKDASQIINISIIITIYFNINAVSLDENQNITFILCHIFHMFSQYCQQYAVYY